MDREWLERELGEWPSYAHVDVGGKPIGVIRLLDSGLHTGEDVYFDPTAWLDPPPVPDSHIELRSATAAQYQEWRKKHTRHRRILFWASVLLALGAGVIELSWNVGKYWSLWHPNDFWAGFSELVKWAMVGLGVAGITWYKDYRLIE